MAEAVATVVDGLHKLVTDEAKETQSILNNTSKKEEKAPSDLEKLLTAVTRDEKSLLNPDQPSVRQNTDVSTYLSRSSSNGLKTAIPEGFALLYDELKKYNEISSSALNTPTTSEESSFLKTLTTESLSKVISDSIKKLFTSENLSTFGSLLSSAGIYAALAAAVLYGFNNYKNQQKQAEQAGEDAYNKALEEGKSELYAELIKDKSSDSTSASFAATDIKMAYERSVKRTEDVLNEELSDRETLEKLYKLDRDHKEQIATLLEVSGLNIEDYKKGLSVDFSTISNDILDSITDAYKEIYTPELFKKQNAEEARALQAAIDAKNAGYGEHYERRDEQAVKNEIEATRKYTQEKYGEKAFNLAEEKLREDEISYLNTLNTSQFSKTSIPNTISGQDPMTALKASLVGMSYDEYITAQQNQTLSTLTDLNGIDFAANAAQATSFINTVTPFIAAASISGVGLSSLNKGAAIASLLNATTPVAADSLADIPFTKDFKDTTESVEAMETQSAKDTAVNTEITAKAIVELVDGVNQLILATKAKGGTAYSQPLVIDTSTGSNSYNMDTPATGTTVGRTGR